MDFDGACYLAATAIKIERGTHVGCAIIGCGKALPALDVTNDDMAKLVDTSDEWISKRTGIKSRKVAITETTTDLAEQASRQAMGWIEGGYSEREINPEEIDLVVLSTVTADVLVPSNAAIIRRRLGLKNAACFDLNAACSGFIYALTVAEAMVAASATAKNRSDMVRALVISVDRPSRITNWEDRNTCVLLGDGAGAVVIEYDPSRAGILSTYIANEDDVHNSLTCPMPLDVVPPFDENGVNFDAPNQPEKSHGSIDEELGIVESLEAGAPRNVLRMNGQQVFKFSGRAMKQAVSEVCQRAGVPINEVKLVVPHQANERIIDFGARRMDVTKDLFQVSIAHRGNSSGASVPMALADAYEQGAIHKGDKIVLVAFGGGFTLGAVLYEV